MFEIVGIQSVSFVGKDKNKVEGISLFCIDQSYENPALVGHRAERIFLPASKGYTVHSFAVGDLVHVSYNRYGKPEAVNALV